MIRAKLTCNRCGAVVKYTQSELFEAPMDVARSLFYFETRSAGWGQVVLLANNCEAHGCCPKCQAETRKLYKKIINNASPR